MAGAVESIKRWQLPQSVTSPVVNPAQVKQTTKLPVKKTGYVPLTREQFMKAQSSGFTPDQIIEMEKRRKAEMEWATKAPETWIGKTFLPQSTEQAINRLKEAPKVYQDVVWGVVGSIPSQLGNIAKFGTDVWNALLPWQPLAGLGQKAQQLGQQWQEAIQGAYGSRPETPYTKAGEFAGEAIGGTLLGGWLVKWASMIPKAQQALQNAPALVKFGAKVAKWATEWLGFDVASEWKVGAGTVIGAGIPFVWATLTKAKDLITKSLPKWLISSWLATPTKLLNASERLSKLADDWILDVDSAPQWMLDKWLKWNKKQIAAQLRDVVKESAQKKAALLSNPAPVKDLQKVQELQLALWDILKNYAKVDKKWVVTPKPWNKDIVEQILAFINSKTPNAAQFDDARSILGDAGIFKKTGEMVDEGSKRGLQKIWIDASKYLDEAYPGFRSLNKDIEVAMALWQAIGLKEAQDLARKYWNLVNLWAGAGGAYAGYQAWGLKGAGIWLVTGLAGKYVINNPAVTTSLAQWLAKSWPWLDKIFKIWAKSNRVIIPAVNSLNEKE